MFFVVAWFAVSLSQAEAAAAPPPPKPAACVVPTPPVSIRPTLPPVPKLPGCVNQARGTHTCRKGEIDRYNAAMKARNNAMEDFISAANAYSVLLNQYTLAANDYARCELREVRKAED
jgi:hypothetical protein